MRGIFSWTSRNFSWFHIFHIVRKTEKKSLLFFSCFVLRHDYAFHACFSTSKPTGIGLFRFTDSECPRSYMIRADRMGRSSLDFTCSFVTLIEKRSRGMKRHRNASLIGHCAQRQQTNCHIFSILSLLPMPISRVFPRVLTLQRLIASFRCVGRISLEFREINIINYL